MSVTAIVNAHLRDLGFQKTTWAGDYYVKQTFDNFYLCAKVRCEKNGNFFDEDRGGMSCQTYLPLYDIVFGLGNAVDFLHINSLANTNDSLRIVGWINDEEAVAQGLVKDFHKVIYDPLFVDRTPDFSIYDFMKNLRFSYRKISYPNIDYVTAAFVDKRYADAYYETLALIKWLIFRESDENYSNFINEKESVLREETEKLSKEKIEQYKKEYMHKRDWKKISLVFQYYDYLRKLKDEGIF